MTISFSQPCMAFDAGKKGYIVCIVWTSGINFEGVSKDTRMHWCSCNDGISYMHGMPKRDYFRFVRSHGRPYHFFSWAGWPHLIRIPSASGLDFPRINLSFVLVLRALCTYTNASCFLSGRLLRNYFSFLVKSERSFQICFLSCQI